MSVWVRSHDECLTGFKTLEEALAAAKAKGLVMGEQGTVKVRALFDSRTGGWDIVVRRKQTA